jgi:hypothetical protein
MHPIALPVLNPQCFMRVYSGWFGDPMILSVVFGELIFYSKEVVIEQFSYLLYDIRRAINTGSTLSDTIRSYQEVSERDEDSSLWP